MADNKGKTKAAILHELESIKGLLVENDEIPILQEAVVDGTAETERPLPKRDLDELHDVFQALSRNIRSASGKIGLPPAASATPRSPSLFDTLVSPTGKNDNTKPEHARQQGSLFGDEKARNADRDYLDEETVNPLDEDTEELADRPLDSADEQKSSGRPEQPLNYAVSKSITPPRPALAKASGENPFLPQHIRARLHGNNPPPLFEPGVAEKPTAMVQTKPVPEPLNRHQLIRDVIASVMPQLEQELRQRLLPLTEEQLLEMLQDKQ